MAEIYDMDHSITAQNFKEFYFSNLPCSAPFLKEITSIKIQQE
jgi:hypothetical protein